MEITFSATQYNQNHHKCKIVQTVLPVYFDSIFVYSQDQACNACFLYPCERPTCIGTSIHVNKIVFNHATHLQCHKTQSKSRNVKKIIK